MTQGRGDGPATTTPEGSDGHLLPKQILEYLWEDGNREEDVIRTIVIGMSGTTMLSFGDALSPRQLRQIVFLLVEWRKAPSP
ncbi:hypothetical protein OAG07_01250 [Verrucomicrobia bacterium]|nr:hypothetical protein [Verrucomicrobiota bacterium]MDB4642073.1 hypothetical protein [Verrucomicrobiota bacterium]MDB4717983.1 hypothetical protein [Verrucomicrobiota bacterium]MDB4778410.1 hypothetical protein [Verrucomicrobiota bacterium]